MNNENDPNVIYKGDVEEFVDYSTVGDLLIRSFKSGGDRVCLVKNLKNFLIDFF